MCVLGASAGASCEKMPGAPDKHQVQQKRGNTFPRCVQSACSHICTRELGPSCKSNLSGKLLVTRIRNEQDFNQMHRIGTSTFSSRFLKSKFKEKRAAIRWLSRCR